MFEDRLGLIRILLIRTPFPRGEYRRVLTCMSRKTQAHVIVGVSLEAKMERPPFPFPNLRVSPHFQGFPYRLLHVSLLD